MSNKVINKIADNTDSSLFEFAEYDASKAELTGYSNYSFWRSTIQVFLKNKMAVTLLIIVGCIVLFTLVQPYLPNQKLPNKIYLDPATGMQLRNQAPNGEYWFGTNSIGTGFMGTYMEWNKNIAFHRICSWLI